MAFDDTQESDISSEKSEQLPKQPQLAEKPPRSQEQVQTEYSTARAAAQPTPVASRAQAPQKAAFGQPPPQSARSGGALDALTQHYQQAQASQAQAQAQAQALAQARAAKGAPAIQPTYQPRVNTPRPSARDALVSELEAEKRARGQRPVAPAHYSMGPTGYVGFNQVYGANAATAQRAADALLGRVRGDVRGAYADLADKYKAFQGDVDTAARHTARTGEEYGGPTTFDTGALSDEFATAGDELAALGQGAGGVQALAPRTSSFGASLAASAAEPESERLVRRYSGIDTALGQAGERAEGYADQRAQQAQETYVAAMADQDRLLNQATAYDPVVEGTRIAEQNNFGSLDEMLQKAYADMQSSGQPTGSFEEYKQKYLADLTSRHNLGSNVRVA